MSRCPRTSAVLDRLFMAGELTTGQAAHASACERCAREVALARRFQGELRAASVDLASVASAADAGARRTRRLDRGGTLALMRSVLTGVVAVFVVVGIGWAATSVRWQGGNGAGVLPAGRGPALPTATHEDARRQQAEREAQEVEAAQGRRMVDEFMRQVGDSVLADAGWATVQADVCGRTVAVTVERSAPHSDLLWVAGEPADERANSGQAEAVDASALAALKAETTDRCRRVVSAPMRGELVSTIDAGAGIAADFTLLDAELVAPDLAIAVVEGTPLFGQHQRWIGSLLRRADRWTTEPEQWIGANIPANDGMTPYALGDHGLAVNHTVIVGAVPSGAVEVELEIDGTAYRYGVDADSTGVVIVAPPPFRGDAEFRIFDATGREIDRGTIAR